MPRRRVARKMVSPSRMSTSRSSMLKVLGFALPLLLIVHLARILARLVQNERRTRCAPLPLVGREQTAFAARFAPSPSSERLRQLLREILQHAQQRVRRRLAEPADRGVAHGVGQFS